jgi:virginiamycin B lyase
MGYLVIFDPNSQSFSDFIEIPNWKTKGEFGSMVWDMKFDKKGDLWFTDQVNNAIWRYFPTDKRFEMYKVPTNGSYPSSIAFDSQDRVWFSEIFGKKLGVMLTRSKHPIILQMEYKNIN